jgi:hypothetical protein
MRSAALRRSLAVLPLAGLLATALAACGESTASKPQPAPAIGPLDGFGAPQVGTTSYPVPADARYVATTGDDGASGSVEAPWRSLEHAVAATPSGATIVIREGTYREGVEIPATKRLTLQPASGEEVWISGSDVIGGWIREDSGTWRRPGWTYNISGGTLDPTLVNADHPFAGDPDQLFLDGRPLTQVGRRSDVGPGSFFVDEAADTLWMGDDPSGRTVEASVRADGLTIKSNGTVVRGLGFRHYATPVARLGAVKAQGNDITIEDCVFTQNAASGLDVRGDDVRVVSSTAIDNGQLGMRATDAHRLTVENSLLRRNNVERFSAIAASGGIKIAESDGVVLRHNLAEDNLSHGLWLDLSSDDAAVVRNISRRNLRGGIIIEMSVRPIIASNSSVDNEAGVIVSETSNAQVWNNALVENQISAHIVDGRRAPLPVDIALHNNIVSSSVASSRPLVIVDDVNQRRSGWDMRVTTDRNAYYRKSTVFTPYLMSWANYPSGKLVLRSLPDVQARVGQDRTSNIVDNAQSDPNVDDVEAGRYGLPAGNVLGAAGVPLPPAVAAALGAPAGLPVPVGILPESTLLNG